MGIPPKTTTNIAVKSCIFDTSPVNFQLKKVVNIINGIKIVVAKTKPS